jgi:hypothetical protein
LLEAVIAGAVTCIIAEELRAEVTEVLGRQSVRGWTPQQVDDYFGPVWIAARVVEMAADDPKYLKFVHDPDDVTILRIASGTFFHPDLASAPRKFIVSSDGRAFPHGVNWNGFECCTASAFMERLRDALE